MFKFNKLVWIGLFLLVLVIAIVYVAMRPQPLGRNGSQTSAVAYFTQRTQDKILREVGQPMEGFEQSMFFRVYPGLTVEDFRGVETIGDTQPRGTVSSADAAITAYGMGTLLENIGRRLNQSFENETQVDVILTLMEQAPSEDPTVGTDETLPKRMTLSGTYLCLPHVDTSGPQTLECAFGIKTDDGTYYALDFMLMSQLAPNVPMNARITANGLLTPIERLSTDHWRKYPIKGIFSVTDSVEVVE